MKTDILADFYFISGFLNIAPAEMTVEKIYRVIDQINDYHQMAVFCSRLLKCEDAKWRTLRDAENKCWKVLNDIKQMLRTAIVVTQKIQKQEMPLYSLNHEDEKFQIARGNNYFGALEHSYNEISRAKLLPEYTVAIKLDELKMDKNKFYFKKKGHTLEYEIMPDDEKIIVGRISNSEFKKYTKQDISKPLDPDILQLLLPILVDNTWKQLYPDNSLEGKNLSFLERKTPQNQFLSVLYFMGFYLIDHLDPNWNTLDSQTWKNVLLKKNTRLLEITEICMQREKSIVTDAEDSKSPDFYGILEEHANFIKKLENPLSWQFPISESFLLKVYRCGQMQRRLWRDRSKKYIPKKLENQTFLLWVKICTILDLDENKPHSLEELAKAYLRLHTDYARLSEDAPLVIDILVHYITEISKYYKEEVAFLPKPTESLSLDVIKIEKQKAIYLRELLQKNSEYSLICIEDKKDIHSTDDDLFFAMPLNFFLQKIKLDDALIYAYYCGFFNIDFSIKDIKKMNEKLQDGHKNLLLANNYDRAYGFTHQGKISKENLLILEEIAKSSLEMVKSNYEYFCTHFSAGRPLFPKIYLEKINDWQEAVSHQWGLGQHHYKVVMNSFNSSLEKAMLLEKQQKELDVTIDIRQEEKHSLAKSKEKNLGKIKEILDNTDWSMLFELSQLDIVDKELDGHTSKNFEKYKLLEENLIKVIKDVSRLSGFSPEKILTILVNSLGIQLSRFSAIVAACSETSASFSASTTSSISTSISSSFFTTSPGSGVVTSPTFVCEPR